MELLSPASQAEQSRLPALLPARSDTSSSSSQLGVCMWAQGGVAQPRPPPLWWGVGRRCSLQDVWPGDREGKVKKLWWRGSVPTEGGRGDTSACCLGRAALATVHSILGSGTLGVLRVGFLMGLPGVDGFNGWSKPAFIYFIFLAAAASGMLCIFLAVTACLGYLDVEVHLFPSWWTFFSETLRHLQWHVVVHFHTSIYKMNSESSEMVIESCVSGGWAVVAQISYCDTQSSNLLAPQYPDCSVVEGETMNICTCECCRPYVPSLLDILFYSFVFFLAFIIIKVFICVSTSGWMFYYTT